MNTKDTTTTTDMTMLLEECYSRVPKIDEGIVTVEALVDAVYCALDPALEAPVALQWPVLHQLDKLATEFCNKRDGSHYRIFDDESWYWTGKWTRSERTPYPIRTWALRESARRARQLPELDDTWS